MSVRIYKLSKGFEKYTWLCDPCAAKAEAAGWEVKGRKTPPHPLRCDECRHDDATATTTERAA